jgi:hypothetical protein
LFGSTLSLPPVIVKKQNAELMWVPSSPRHRATIRGENEEETGGRTIRAVPLSLARIGSSHSPAARAHHLGRRVWRAACEYEQWHGDDQNQS